MTVKFEKVSEQQVVKVAHKSQRHRKPEGKMSIKIGELEMKENFQDVLL